MEYLFNNITACTIWTMLKMNGSHYSTAKKVF